MVSAQTMVRGSAPDFGWFGAHGNSTHNDGISYLATTAQVKASGGADRQDRARRFTAQSTGSHP